VIRVKVAPQKQKPERKKKQREPKTKAAPAPKQAAPKKGGATPKLTAKDLPRVIEALRVSGGMKTGAAEMLKVSRRTLYTFLDEHPEIQEAAKEIGEELLDLAEGQVAAAIRAGEMPTVRWFLELKGKERGYIRRVETTGKDGGPVEIRNERSPDEIAKSIEGKLDRLYAAGGKG
jgi:hypothetical protein